jgi:tRNA(adenine34) deaminase
MRVALAEAERALQAGEVPVGAVVLVEGRVVAARHNEREARADPTAHAELLALRDAAGVLGRWRLDDATVVVTLEPCPMCAGALVAARVARLVFAAADPKGGACGSLYNLCCDPRLNHELPVVPGVLADEAAALMSGFFAGRRRSSEASANVRGGGMRERPNRAVSKTVVPPGTVGSNPTPSAGARHLGRPSAC